MSITLLPLHSLSASPRNVRKTGGERFDDLKASIAAIGLLQNLQVIATGKGKKTRYEVVAGGRRLLALQALAGEGVIAADYAVPCQIVEDEAVTEISLAENAIRQEMHPADQFEAFKRLSDEGKCAADIAARFGVSEHTVLQRLKLASVSAALLEIYREGNMTLQQLMAFTVSDDHGKQESVWLALQGTYNDNASAIRRALTETRISGKDPRAKCIGEEAYCAAGGSITRDLFSEDVYFDDTERLNRLLTDRLVAYAEPLKAEGWKWIQADLLDKEDIRQYGRIQGEPVPLTEEEETELARLEAEQEALSDAYEHKEMDEDEAMEQSEALEEAIACLQNRPSQYRVEDKARAGIIIRLNRAGEFVPVFGLVRPEDKTVAEAEAEKSSSGSNKTKPRISAKLLEELTAHRSAAIAYTLVEHPETAMTALLHRMLHSVFPNYTGNPCLMLQVNCTSYAKYDTVKSGLAALVLEEQHETWLSQMPEDNAERWHWLCSLDDGQRKALLAYCVAMTVDTIIMPMPAGYRVTPKTPLLVEYVPVNMAEFWEPTAESYFSRVNKQAIQAAVAEVCGDREAHFLGKQKRQAMIANAAKHLQGKGWLPPELRQEEAAAEVRDAPEEEAEEEPTFTEDEIHAAA